MANLVLCLGPTFQSKKFWQLDGNPNVTILPASAGEPHWLKATGAWGVVADAYESVGTLTAQFWYCYYHGHPLPLNKYRTILFTQYTVAGIPPQTFDVELRFINDAGTHKLSLTENGTPLGTSGPVAANVTHAISMRVDGSTWRVWSDGVEVITVAKTPYLTRDRWRGGHSDAGSEGAGHWSCMQIYESTALDLDSTAKPEVRGHIPDGDGFWSDYGNEASCTNSAGNFTKWDDLAGDSEPDDDTTFNCGPDSLGIQRQTSTLSNKIYSNPIKGVAWQARLRAQVGNKDLPHQALFREAGTDKLLVLPNANSASYELWLGCITNPPSGGTWTQAKMDALEAGHYRDVTAGDDDNVLVTALAVEGAALGAFSVPPADPPPPTVAVGRRSRLVQVV